MWKFPGKLNITQGLLRVMDTQGEQLCFGKAHEDNEAIVIRNASDLSAKRLLARPALFRQAYVSGNIRFLSGTLSDFLILLAENNVMLPEIDNAFPILLSELGISPSFGYFNADNDSLQKAHIGHYRHVAARLLLEPDMRLLNLTGNTECALYLARKTGASIISLYGCEQEKLAAAAFIASTGYGRQIQLQLASDFATIEKFDRVLFSSFLPSVTTPDVYASASEMLKPSGIAVIHGICRKPSHQHSALAAIIATAEMKGAWVSDIEPLQTHVLLTLAAWQQALQSARRTAIAHHGEVRFRACEYYIASLISSFSRHRFSSYALQITASLGNLPLTRSEVYERERAFALVQRISSQRRYALH